MALVILASSHTDHSIPRNVLDWLVRRHVDKTGFFIETVELPEEFGQINCSLHGPSVGDPPVPFSEVDWVTRGDRKYLTRMCRRPVRKTRTITVIAGPQGPMWDNSEPQPCILYTAFGGPLAPKEIFDPSLKPEEIEESFRFWCDHALGI